ncbi:hypothetical protein AB6829_08650 [Carnobacterium divergens]|uniref:hypothetical protein n=1 Tax=Carnobacterium divergens TaxID=2748 RepID=UPI0039C941AA
MATGIDVVATVISKDQRAVASYYTLMTSFSVMLIPLITGNLSEVNIKLVMIFNAGVTLVGFLLAILVYVRYQRLHRIEEADVLVGNETFEY